MTAGRTARRDSTEEKPIQQPTFKVATGVCNFFQQDPNANETLTAKQRAIMMLRQQRKKQENAQLAINAGHRRDIWLGQASAHPEVAALTQTGSQDRINREKIENGPEVYPAPAWRERSENANVYVRNYEPAAERAAEAESRNKAMLLKSTIYRQDDPLRRNYLRANSPIKQKGLGSFNSYSRNALERTQQAI